MDFRIWFTQCLIVQLFLLWQKGSLTKIRQKKSCFFISWYFGNIVQQRILPQNPTRNLWFIIALWFSDDATASLFWEIHCDIWVNYLACLVLVIYVLRGCWSITISIAHWKWWWSTWPRLYLLSLKKDMWIHF